MRFSQAHGLVLVAGRAALEAARGSLDGEAKVQDLDDAVPREADVLRFDVAVDDVVLLVEDADGHGQLGQEIASQIRLDAIQVVGVEAGQVAALDVLGDHEDLVVPLHREEEPQEVVLGRLGVEQPQDPDLALRGAVRALGLRRPLHHDPRPVQPPDRRGAEEGDVADGEAAAPDDVRELHGDRVRLEHAPGADPQGVRDAALPEDVLGASDRARPLGAEGQGLGRQGDCWRGFLGLGQIEWDVGNEVDVFLLISATVAVTGALFRCAHLLGVVPRNGLVFGGIVCNAVKRKATGSNFPDLKWD